MFFLFIRLGFFVYLFWFLAGSSLLGLRLHTLAAQISVQLFFPVAGWFEVCVIQRSARRFRKTWLIEAGPPWICHSPFLDFLLRFPEAMATFSSVSDFWDQKDGKFFLLPLASLCHTMTMAYSQDKIATKRQTHPPLITSKFQLLSQICLHWLSRSFGYILHFIYCVQSI